MKKLVHYLELRAFKYPTESSDKLKRAINTVLELNEKQLTKKLKKETLQTKEAEIVKYTYRTSNHGEIKNIVKKITSAEKSSVDPTKQMDEEGSLYIRINKQKAYQGKIETERTGDIIHIRIKVAAYPATKKNLDDNLKELLGR